MKTLRDLTLLRDEPGPVCLAAGYFDGVHRGHQAVIRHAREHARAAGGTAWAMTFDTHPLKILQPRTAPRLLTSTPHKLRLLAQLGLDGCLVLPFTRALAETEPEAFLDQLGRAIPQLGIILVGSNWRFGRNGRGDIALLRQWAAARGCRVALTRPVLRHGAPISSTRIRQAIADGLLAEAAAMLGRPFSLLATVVAGQGRGRQLGYPTANLDPHNEVRPPRGVYAVRAVLAGAAYDGVANFGVKPTVATASHPVIEVHLFDAALELYGHELEVFFFRRLRAERRFASTDALRAQIARDAAAARASLAAAPAKNLWIKTLQVWLPATIVPSEKTK